MTTNSGAHPVSQDRAFAASPSSPSVSPVPASIPLRVLVACECSGVVRRAFRVLGHNAWSCDLLPAEDGSPHHIHGDAIKTAYACGPWDMLIGFPECTFLANSGAKHLYAGMNAINGPNPDRWANMGFAAAFFMTLWNAPIKRIALENPIMLGHPQRLFGIPEPTQIIQPWMFGHGETKATCLRLKNLPTLKPTHIVAGREPRVWRMGPGPDRKRDRSRTLTGIGEAMAAQWGALAIADRNPTGGDVQQAPSRSDESGGAKQSPNNPLHPQTTD